MLKSVYHPEYQYLKLLKNIIDNGEIIQGRNGITKTIFGTSMRFSLENEFPLLTTKKMAWKTCLKELLWFISGDTDNKNLKKQNVHIWDKNGTRKYLDSRNLHYLKEDDLGPIYGHQWRSFNAPYINSENKLENRGVDQLQNIIDKLSCPKERHSRRLILSAWNPQQLNQMALPPCHIISQFHVNMKNELSCSLYQRSGDVGLGIPFNIASYSFLTYLLAKHCNLKPKEFIHFIGNAHIYEEHEDSLMEQLLRKPKKFPKLYLKQKREDINNYNINDFVLENYNYYSKINMDMKE